MSGVRFYYYRGVSQLKVIMLEEDTMQRIYYFLDGTKEVYRQLPSQDLTSADDYEEFIKRLGYRRVSEAFALAWIL